MIDKYHWCYDCKHRETKLFIIDGLGETSPMDYCKLDETPCSGTYRCGHKEEVE